MGPDFILANLSVDFKDSVSAEEVESSVAVLDQKIKLAYPEIKRIFIESEPHKAKT